LRTLPALTALLFVATISESVTVDRELVTSALTWITGVIGAMGLFFAYVFKRLLDGHKEAVDSLRVAVNNSTAFMETIKRRDEEIDRLNEKP
jgi:hypothetical protein